MTRPTPLVLAVLAACGGATHATTPRDHAQSEAPVATTARFTVYSRFDFNLYDRLLRWARAGDRDGAACVAELGPRERAPWDRAVAAFAPLAAADAGRVELRVRYELVFPGDTRFDEHLGPVPTWLRPAMRDAAPTYRRCWWRDDDRRNRAWIDALVPRLRRVEDRIAARIAELHAVPWETRPWTVDVVPFVSREGGNTVVGPDHTLVTSTGPGFESFGGIEMLFHEVSHTTVSPRSGGSIAALRRAAEAEGVELPPALWHAVLFYTAGEVTAAAIRDEWGVDYVQYMVTQHVFESMHAPLAAEWRPYLEGTRSLEDAARALVRAVTSSPGER